jgi:hypothetical protein
LNAKVGSKSSSGKSSGTILRTSIFFPWEIITDSGEFVNEQDFRRVEGETGKVALKAHSGKRASDYRVFKAIWQRAQQEITQAVKVSFVGFSANQFMKHGLQFLFKKRAGKLATGRELTLKVITANPESGPKAHRGGSLHGNAHVDRLHSLLTEACQGKVGWGQIVRYPDFKSFIQAEMDP